MRITLRKKIPKISKACFVALLVGSLLMIVGGPVVITSLLNPNIKLRLNRAEKGIHQQVVQEIENLDGRVFFPAYIKSDDVVGTSIEFSEMKLSGKHFDLIRRVPGPVFLDIVDCELEPFSLNSLDGMANLRSLYFGRMTASPETLEALSSLPELRTFSILDTKLDDRSVRFLQSSTHLGTLEISGTNISDSTMERLRGKTELYQLIISGTKVTDKGLLAISDSSQNLWYFNAADTSIGDVGILSMNLKELREANLSRTNITDEGMKKFRETLLLSDLRISETKVTKNGIDNLKELFYFSNLFAYKTNISKENARQRLPKVNIYLSDE